MLPSPTIFALASAPGRAGVAVVRISGDGAAQAIAQLCQPGTIPEPRRAALRRFVDPRTGEVIDQGLALFFPAPHSFTGEDVAEFHLHGGRAIVKGVVEALQALPGFRPAEPGEFTRRAFENGKLDLTEAEAIADLVDAETAAQRRQALRQLDGALGRLYHGWAERLTRSLAHLEADIDFADEDLPPDLAEQRLQDVRALLRELDAHLNDAHRGERLREGFTIAILGPPNAGKSSLLNALAQREAAIVSPIAGTTRDIIEVQLDLGGYPVTLADTAGLRESADMIESEGIRRALARAAQADLKLLVFDGASWPELDAATLALLDKDSLAVVNKADVIGASSFLASPKQPASPPTPPARGGEALAASVAPQEPHLLPVSATTGQNLAALTQRLAQEIERRFGSHEQPSLTRARHRAALEECRDHLRRALTAPQPELRAEDHRLAVRALGRITGRVDVEDLLDVIFREFCIGK